MSKLMMVVEKDEVISLMKKYRRQNDPTDPLPWLTVIYWSCKIIMFRLFGKKRTRTVKDYNSEVID